MSQRELAKAANVSASTVGRVESGAIVPTLSLLMRLLAVGGFHLVAVDAEGRVLQPMRDTEDTRDGADRRYPSHLDTILDPRPGEWWADFFGLARPPETFRRDRKRRDAARARSRWEVRVARLRNAPEPPEPGAVEAREAWHRGFRAGRNANAVPMLDSADYDVDEWLGDADANPPRRRGRST